MHFYVRTMDSVFGIVHSYEISSDCRNQIAHCLPVFALESTA